MIKYDDLLQAPYKKGGRGDGGFDCYGLLLECMRRDGKTLKDIAATPDGNLAEYVESLDVEQRDSAQPGYGVQFNFSGGLHVGYMLDKRTALHMTYNGARVSPIFALHNHKFFEVAQ